MNVQTKNLYAASKLESLHALISREKAQNTTSDGWSGKRQF